MSALHCFKSSSPPELGMGEQREADNRVSERATLLILSLLTAEELPATDVQKRDCT